MKYTIFVDQKISLEWGLNSNQAALFSILTNLNSWAKEIVYNGKVYYFAARQMIINEIPLYYSKPDTIYKALCKMRDLEIIEYIKFGNKDIIRLTDKGKGWNTINSSNSEINPSKLGNKPNSSEHSEINPSKLGNKSEFNSDLNPTYHTTREDQYTKNQLLNLFINKSGKKSRIVTEKAWRQFKARIKEGFTIEEIGIAIENCKNDKWHIENPQYLTIEFITRGDKLEKYLNISLIPTKDNKKFYDKQVEIAKQQGDNTYLLFAEWLFTKNLTGKPLNGVLGMNEQISTTTLKKWLKSYSNEEIKQSILSLENHSNRNYESFTLTISTWLSQKK